MQNEEITALRFRISALELAFETLLIAQGPDVVALVAQGYEGARHARIASLLQHAQQDSTVHAMDAACAAQAERLQRLVVATQGFPPPPG